MKASHCEMPSTKSTANIDRLKASKKKVEDPIHRPNSCPKHRKRNIKRKNKLRGEYIRRRNT